MKIVYRHLYWKDENKEKEDGNIPFFKKNSQLYTEPDYRAFSPYILPQSCKE